MQGGATGTGTVTLLAPITNTNRTLTLPDDTDTVAGIAATQTLTNKTLTSPTLTTPNIDSAQFATVTGTAPIYPCRAWVNFNGTGTPAIRASGNVSSITDNGTGDYTLNFTTAMPDVNYVGLVTAGDYGTNARSAGGNTNATRLTGSYRILTSNASQSVLTDCDTVYVAIFR
jgi:hypothetical protein